MKYYNSTSSSCILLWVIFYINKNNAVDEFCTKDLKVIRNHTNADYIIGGLFPFHFFKTDSYQYNEPGLIWSEAMIYAIDEINRNPNILPHTVLGYEIYDTCNTIHIALEATLRLTQLNSDKQNSTTCQCNVPTKSVIALIGDAASATTTRVASIFSALKTTQISYSATSTDLSAKHLYPSFLRTIPPDNYQAAALAELMFYFNWSYINIIACDDNYGRVGTNTLLPLLAKYNICVAHYELYDVKNDKNGAKTSFVIQKLLKENEARTIILWCQRPEAMTVLRKAEELKLYYRTWIATEAYARSDQLKDIHPNVIKGMFGVIPSADVYKPFENELKKITPKTPTKHPWLKKYWERKNCNISGDSYKCVDDNITLDKLPKSKYVNVMNGVYAVAHGLDNYLGNHKNNKKFKFENKILLEYVKNVTFKGQSNVNISFDSLGNPGVITYSIVNMQFNKTNNLSIEVVGTCEGEKITFSNINLHYAESTQPSSTCKESCSPGYGVILFGDRPCCWKCVKCSEDKIQPDYNQNANKCYKCKDGKLPNQNQTKCIIPDIEYLQISESRNLVLIIMSIISAIFVLSTIIILIKLRDTPIVRALNFHLSLLQLFSMFLIIALPLVVFGFEQTTTTCMVQMYYFTFFYIIAISVTFTKADLLLRIFKASKSGILSKRSRVKSNKVQYLTVFSLTMAGIVLCTVLYFTFKPHIDSNVLEITNDSITMSYHCAGHYDTILFISLAYIGVISLICGVYAFKARKLPATYNEARYTSFAMFIFVLTWMMFIPLYFSMTSKFSRLIIWCYISLVTNVSVYTLMYIPKVLILLFKPEENTREKFRERMKVTNVVVYDTDENHLQVCNTSYTMNSKSSNSCLT